MAFSFLTSVFGGPAGQLAVKAMGEEATGQMDKAFNSAIKGAVFGPAAMLLNDSSANVRDSEESYVNCRMACQFGDSRNIADWTRELDNKLAVGCYEVLKALKAEISKKSGNDLDWEDALRIFRQNDYVDKSNDKEIKGRRSWNEMNHFKFDGSPDEVRRREIKAWLKDLFNEKNEQAIVDNSIIFSWDVLHELASIASQSGATVKDPVTLVAADDEERKKVKEVGLIRFPTKGSSKIKLYRVMIYAWSKCSRFLFAQHDQNGIEIDCNVCEYNIDTSNTDLRRARQAKQKMSEEGFWDF